MSGLAARPEISITVPQTPSPANKTEDENETALSEMAGLLVLWARARMRGGVHREEGMPDNIRRNKNRGRDAGKSTEERNERGCGRGLFVVLSTSSPIYDVTPKV